MCVCEVLSQVISDIYSYILAVHYTALPAITYLITEFIQEPNIYQWIKCLNAKRIQFILCLERVETTVVKTIAYSRAIVAV